MLRRGFGPNFSAVFLKRHGSLTSAATMQLAINEAGAGPYAYGSSSRGSGRLLKKPGLFYRVAGPAVALIDDVAGTMPPYHEFIVLGPKNSDQVAQVYC
jgi:hypothetical protein